MFLKDLAGIIFKEGTESEDRNITVRHHFYNVNKNKYVILWSGKAKDLHTMKNIENYAVVQILIDENDMRDMMPSYNKNKIIEVI